MKRLLALLIGIGGLGLPARAACTVSGAPGVITLNSRVVLTQDNDLWKQGVVQWDVTAEQNDTQAYTWLQWSMWPTGQGCTVSFLGYSNDTCAGRVQVQFQQSSPYNSGVVATDTAQGNATYPLACSVQINFHIFDQNGNPNPCYDPTIPDPSNPCSHPTIVDPGFDFSASVQLNVSAVQMILQGGNPGTPPGVTQNGNCPLPEANEIYPAYMFTGPGCAPPPVNSQTNSQNPDVMPSPSAMIVVANGAGTATRVTLTAIVTNTQARRAAMAAQIQSASAASLRTALAAAMARTKVKNGRPVIGNE